MQGAGGSELGPGGLPKIGIAKPIADAYVRRREKFFSKPIISAFKTVGVRPALGLALARHESEFRAKAVNNTGGDAMRGGSYGIMQVSMRTAKEFGYKGAWEGLLQVPMCALMAAKICLANQEKVPVATTRDIDNVQWCMDMAALYNSGHLYKDCPRSTREVYVPRVTSYFLYYQHVLDLGASLILSSS